MKLKNYQLKIVERCKTTRRLILSVGMGLGKTAAVLHYIDHAKPESLIIVAPKRVAETVWLQEANKWLLSYVANKMIIVSGTPTKRSQALSNAAKPYKIIGRDNLSDVKGFKTDILILDELTSFKNHDSGRSKILHTIESNQTIGLTGTFLANGAIDIFGQAAAVKAFQVTRSSFYRWRATYFRNKFEGSGLQFQKWVLKVPLLDVLKDVEKHIFTLDSSDYLEIPAVEHVNHPIALSKDETTQYNNLQSFLHFEIDGEHVAFDAAQKFGKLQTLCNGFVYSDDENQNRTVLRGQHSTKLEAVADFIESCAAEGERVLLFYSFVEEAVWISEMLKKRHLKFCSPKDKQFLKKWNDGDIDVLIAHPASAGHGLNLQDGGRICVWSSLTYNYEYFAQANARLARTGQQRGVQIHYFFASATVEEQQLKALRVKEKEDKEFINLTK